MIRLEDRRTLVREISQAHANGARLAPACAVAGIDVRTWQRWQIHNERSPVHPDQRQVRADRRPTAVRPTPSYALSSAERAQIIEIANEPRFADVPPARIVPALADEGRYIASESSFHRVLRAHGQMRRRGRARPPRRLRPPTTHIAARPGDVWCWDVTFLPARVQGMWFYFYLIVDLYSRKIVGFEVHETDNAEHAAHLARRTVLSESVHGKAAKPVLHGDNGATLKATTVLAMLHWLGIKPSYSRPRVSDDNAFAEALFRTAKYRPEFPVAGFADLAAARRWASDFVRWYNDEHRHSAIRYVTPGQRHAGQDHHLLGARHALYQVARAHSPRRWSRQTRNWTPIGAVTLNPERTAAIHSAGARTLARTLARTPPCGSIDEPALPSRPGMAIAAARNEGRERSGATRSHAQRDLSREHGEDGEHRTSPEVSTVAALANVGSSNSSVASPRNRSE
jgi:transposase InsO family protein